MPAVGHPLVTLLLRKALDRHLINKLLLEEDS